ncbi:hypothetical protein AOQ72_16755 [Bradyrhizobium yuanmingense]|uniref:Uncharacterized protein n=1 Tax=Bradyrhizobium yuanmingense TaxID=108015 RepID=A0A0R3CLZ8_9BRAD|nr:hypothetical protein AOQ72_16755 [Bradyrhizobium yuanmingense]
MCLVWALLVIKGDPVGEARVQLFAVGIEFEIDVLVLEAAPQLLMNMSSIQRPRPSTEIRAIPRIRKDAVPPPRGVKRDASTELLRS